MRAGGHQALHCLIAGGGRWFLAWRVFPERGEEIANEFQRGRYQEDVINIPIPICIGGDRRPLVRIGSEIVQPGDPRLYERLAPKRQGSWRALLSENKLPI